MGNWKYGLIFPLFVVVVLTIGIPVIPMITGLPIEITFSTGSANPTTVTVNNYYTTEQYDTMFIKVNLVAGETYCLFKARSFHGDLYLYSDSGFSNEIESTNSYCIVYAPASTGNAYLKWVTDGPFEKEFGVFKAEKLTTQQILDGVSLTYINDDWAYCFVYLTVPTCTACEDHWDYEVQNPSVWKWKQITAQSGEAYNYNELGGPGFLDQELYNHQGTNHVVFFNNEGTLQVTLPAITTPETTTSETSNNKNIFLIILIVLGSIIGGIIVLALFFSVLLPNVLKAFEKPRRDRPSPPRRIDKKSLQKEREINLRKIIERYESISLEKMAQLLEFEDLWH